METLITPLMQEATDALIGNLLASEAFIRYQRAHTRLNEDRQARALLEQLSQTQTSLREKQANGGVIQADIDALRAIQEQVQRTNSIMDYAHTQQNAIDGTVRGRGGLPAGNGRCHRAGRELPGKSFRRAPVPGASGWRHRHSAGV